MINEEYERWERENDERDPREKYERYGLDGMVWPWWDRSRGEVESVFDIKTDCASEFGSTLPSTTVETVIMTINLFEVNLI